MEAADVKRSIPLARRSGLRVGAALKRSPLRRKTIFRAGTRELGRLVVDLRELDPFEQRKREREKRKTAYARRPRFLDFMAWVRTLPCLLSGLWSPIKPRAIATPCSGPVQADHLGDRSVNGSYRRAPDSTCGPMCMGHHGERTDSVSCGNGAFAEHPDALMRAWCDGGIEIVQLHALRVGVLVPDDGGRCAAYLAAAIEKGVVGPGGIPW
jgi:hypothetical protein